jgi:subfamily B ATP-binding cassette protein HlyB/CyaB
MPEEAARRVSEALVFRTVAPSSVLARQGQAADKLIIPVSGPLRLVTRTDEGTITTYLRARRSLNLRQVLKGGPWEYSAFADAQTHIVELDANTLLTVLAQDAPLYQRYLERITGRLSVRLAAQALRHGGLLPVAAQRVLSLLEERSVAPGDVIELGNETPWVLVDRGRVAMLHDDEGAAVEVGKLSPGEFYGGAAALGRAAPFRMVAAEPSVIFAIAPRNLRALCLEHENIARTIALEHPAVQLRVRRTFVEFGQEFTQVLAAVIPTEDDLAEEELVEAPPIDVGRIQELLLGLQAPGRPWSPGGALARRVDGFRCQLVEESGAAALASLLKYLDRRVTIASVRRAVGQRVRPSLLDLARVAERQGLMTHAAKLARPRDLKRQRTPFLLALGHEFVVVYQIKGDRVRIFSPLSGLRELWMRDLERGWSGAVLIFEDVRPFVNALHRPADVATDASAPPGAPPREPPRAKRGAYLKLFGDARGAIFAAITAAVAVLALSVVGPRLNGLVVDQVLVYGDVNLLTVVAVGLLLVYFSSFLLSGFRDLCITHLAGMMEYRLSSLTLRHTLGVALDAHGDDRVGSALARIDELNRVRTMLSTDIVQILLQVAQGFVYLILIFFYSWKLGLIVLAAVPASYLVVVLLGRPTRSRYLEMFDEHVRLQSQTTEQVEQVATIKALGGVNHSQRQWEKTLVAKVAIEMRVNRLGVGMIASLDVVDEAVKIATTYVGASMLLGGSLSPGALFTVAQYTTGALSPLLALAGKLDELAQVAASMRRLDELFTHPLEDDESDGIGAELPFQGAITVKNLEFAYPDGPPILRNLNFEVKPGETIAVVGRSGSGKTTLANLLHGTLRATGGEILFDDQDSRSLKLPAIRRQVGIVLQDSKLFAGTIRENIAYGDDRPDENRVKEAARLAAAHEFIARFPARYETFLAQGGLGLSGGQRQRISLARALYRAPRILILDEATSALDSESERAILENMREIVRGRTSIVIAHRLNTVKSADRILVLDAGEIVEAGTHDELVSKRGLYHSLFDRQFQA